MTLRRGDGRATRPTASPSRPEGTTAGWRHGGLAWSAAGACIVVTAAGLMLQALTRSTPVPVDFGSRRAASVSALFFVALPVLGALIAARRPHTVLAWMFIAIGATMSAWVFADGYAAYSVLTSPGSLPGGAVAAWLANWIWIPGWTVTGLMLLVFPEGRAPSPRWRPLGWSLALTGAAFTMATILAEGQLASYPYIDNPLGLVRADTTAVKVTGTLAMLFLGVVVLASLAPRGRRATGEQRQQYRWVTYAATVTVATLLLGWSLFALGVRSPLIDGAVSVITSTLPVAAAVAVLKYRLYDIDVVINKTLVYGALATFVTAVYMVIVVGVGTLVGSTGDRDLPLSITATALVAVAFQPVKERLQAVANRLVYGTRATPYELLAGFSERMGELPGSHEVLGQMATLLGQATGAARVEIWLRSGDALRSAACWPEGDCTEETVPLTGDDALAGRADLAVPVRHRGELLGAFTVEAKPGDPVRPLEAKLAADLASQAGHVMRNVLLTEELVRRLEELRASRQRLVSAQDEERRRLERNLHDGAQQHLVALRLQLGLAAAVAEDEPDQVAPMLTQLQQLAADALENLRDLARGIYPPLLAEQGLEAAVKAHARRLPLPVEVIGEGLGRYSMEAESAVYFCCLEALQNVAKYSGASKVEVRLVGTADALAFTVEDDGRGFDPGTVKLGAGLQNMTDRLHALGGSVDIASSPGQGTRVSGSVAVAPAAAVVDLRTVVASSLPPGGVAAPRSRDVAGATPVTN